MNNKKNQKFDNNSEENFLKNKAKRKRHSQANAKKKQTVSVSRIFKIAGISLGSLLAFVVAIVLGFATYYFALSSDMESAGGIVDDKVNDRHGGRAPDVLVDGNEDGSDERNGYKYYTFLATATDFSGGLTDVIMVARYHNSETDPYVSVLQIPRDTYVKLSPKLEIDSNGSLSSKNFDPKTATIGVKINEAFYRGKKLASSKIDAFLKEIEGKDYDEEEIRKISENKKYKFLKVDVNKAVLYSESDSNTEKNKLKKQISNDFGITYLATLITEYFGIPIDYQAQVSLSGFRGIVDAIGGVDLTVPQRMYYVDEYQDLYIDLYPGYQHLNGAKAEQFVRFRKYLRGDVDRLDAQKLFINAYLDKLLSFSEDVNLSKLLTEINNNIYTSISFNDMLNYSKSLLSMNLGTDVVIQTLPGVGDYVNGVSYFLPYKAEAVKLINEQFNVYNHSIPESSLNMIDYNDVVRKEKPVIGPSTLGVPVDTDEEEFNEADVPGEFEELMDPDDENADEPEDITDGENDTETDETPDDETDSETDNETDGNREDESEDDTDNNDEDVPVDDPVEEDNESSDSDDDKTEENNSSHEDDIPEENTVGGLGIEIPVVSGADLM